LLLVICHLTENPCHVAKDFRLSSTEKGIGLQLESGD